MIKTSLMSVFRNDAEGFYPTLSHPPRSVLSHRHRRGILGLRERFFVRPTLPAIARGYYNDVTMNAMIAICCVLLGGRMSNHPCKSCGHARVCDCKALRIHERECMCIHTTIRHRLNYPRLVPKPGSSPFIMGHDGYWIVPCYLLAATLMDP